MRANPEFFREHGLMGETVAIETGTQGGRTLRSWAHLFREVHTVELDQNLYWIGRRKLSRLKHVTCHHGSSPEVLRRIIDPSKSTLFYLDAHFVGSEGLPQPTSGQCPLLDELAVIVSFSWKQRPRLVVDDRYMFTAEFWENSHRAVWYDRKQWPTMEQIESLLKPHGYSTFTPIGKALLIT